MNIAVGVVAHRSRLVQADALRHRVGAKVWCLDDGTMGCTFNHLSVLDMLAEEAADWALVLEDDAVPVDDLLFHVQRALAFTPAPIVGLYLGTGNPSGQPQRQIRAATMVAQRHNYAWISADCLIGSVGYVIRTSLLIDMLPAIADRDEELPLRISRWAQDWGAQVAYTVPSLVNHADGLPIGHSPLLPRSVRRAWTYGTRENWNTAAVPLGYCNGWSR